ncbi:hypothetical protein DRO54_08850 [Candidatus Bathyarchaeota archaeon]|nr:MAG: hypothetical protein DRO54_08850 [Candidatus Bathyarchaeota archaeon]
MVEFKIRIHPGQRLAYIPKEIYEALGPSCKAVADCCAAVIYNEQTNLPDVIKSLEIILEDLKHRVKRKEASKVDS